MRAKLLNQPTNRPLTGDSILAIGVGGFDVTQDAEQKHVALIYLNEAGAPQLMHLEWYKRFRQEDWNGLYYWIEFKGLPTQVEESFVEWIGLVAEKASRINSGIPYSLFYNEQRSFNSDGTYIERGDGGGLTCATFILALFADFGIPLIDFASWPVNRPGDVKWVEKILPILAKTVVCKFPQDSTNFLSLFLKRHSLKRFRPEETLVTAGLYAGSPLPFEVVAPAGAAMLPHLI